MLLALSLAALFLALIPIAFYAIRAVVAWGDRLAGGAVPVEGR